LASHLYPLIAKEDLLNNFKGSVCAFCETAREKNWKLETFHIKESNVYRMCCLELVLSFLNSHEDYKLNKEVGKKYEYLRRFVCLDRVLFENEKDESFFKKLKKLQCLELSNNGLLSLPDSVSKLKGLKHLEIRNNEMSFKRVLDVLEKQKLNHLTTLKMKNLKFDLDKNERKTIPKLLKKLCKLTILINLPKFIKNKRLSALIFYFLN